MWSGEWPEDASWCFHSQKIHPPGTAETWLSGTALFVHLGQVGPPRWSGQRQLIDDFVEGSLVKALWEELRIPSDGVHGAQIC